MNIFDATHFIHSMLLPPPGYVTAGVKIHYDKTKADNNVIVVKIYGRSFRLTVESGA